MAGADPKEVISLAPQDDLLIPGGSNDQEENGRWNQTAIHKMLYQMIAAAKNNASAATASSSAPTDAFGETPTEEQILVQSLPLLVQGEVEPPELVHKVQPQYPDLARRARIQGKVILEAIIDTMGNVREVRVLRSIPLLDRPALDAVCCWKYKPAMKDGHPVTVFFTVIVDFTLT